MSGLVTWEGERLATLKKHLANGLNVSQIGTRMGVSYQAVSRVMDAHGLKKSDAAGFWTSEERVAFLKADFVAGLSCGQIAKRLTSTFKTPCTRNAVIGKLARLGLSDPSRVKSAKKVSVGRVKNPKPPLVVVSNRVADSQGGAAHIMNRVAAPLTTMGKDHGLTATATLTTLGAHACRWPIGDPRDADFGFCGRPRTHHAYCEAHRAVAYQSVPEARDRAREIKRAMRYA